MQSALAGILREEVEIAVAALKKVLASGVDYLSSNIVKLGRETMIEV